MEKSMLEKPHFECLMQLKSLLEFYELLQHMDGSLTFNEANNLYFHLEQAVADCLEALGVTDELQILDDIDDLDTVNES